MLFSRQAPYLVVRKRKRESICNSENYYEEKERIV